MTLDPQLGAVGPLAITSDGDELVSFGAQAPVVSRWRLDGGGLVTTKIAEGNVVYDGYDFNDGSTLLVAKRNPNATVFNDFDDFALWDPATDQEVDPLPYSGEGTGWLGRDAITASDGLYDVTTRSVIDVGELPEGLEQLLPSAGGERTYLLFSNGDVMTIDVATRQRIGPTLHVDGDPIRVSATRGGSTVVITAVDPDGNNVTTVHDGSTGEQIGPPLLGPDVTSVSLDGILVGATGGDITRYDLDTRQPLADLPGARGEINTLQFSDDGKTLLATSLDQTVSIYDVSTGTRIGDPIPIVVPLIYGGFLRHDGRALAVTDRTGVAIWDLDPMHLRTAACRLAGRNLTTTEWDTYLGDLGERRPTCPEFA